jgi:hypothetical protein
MLIGEIQRGITSGVTITPSEVNKYFKDLPKDSLPLIDSELQFSEIVVYPKVTKEEKEIALEKIKAKMEDGILRINVPKIEQKTKTNLQLIRCCIVVGVLEASQIPCYFLHFIPLLA